jgi:hypothetical protein
MLGGPKQYIIILTNQMPAPWLGGQIFSRGSGLPGPLPPTGAGADRMPQIDRARMLTLIYLSSAAG